MIGVSTTSCSTPRTSWDTSEKAFAIPFVDVPVGPRFPYRVNRRGERMNEGVHVRGVEVVLFVPCGRRQHDVRVDAGRGHAKVEGYEKVELSFRRVGVPFDFIGPNPLLAQLFPLNAVRRAKEVFEKILVAFARGAQQV